MLYTSELVAKTIFHNTTQVAVKFTTVPWKWVQHA